MFRDFITPVKLTFSLPDQLLEEKKLCTIVTENSVLLFTENRVVLFTDYNDGTVMSRVDYTLRTTATASYILWNKGDKFEWEKLPDFAQVSPITKTIVRDINNAILIFAYRIVYKTEEI